MRITIGDVIASLDAFHEPRAISRHLDNSELAQSHRQLVFGAQALRDLSGAPERFLCAIEIGLARGGV